MLKITRLTSLRQLEILLDYREVEHQMNSGVDLLNEEEQREYKELNADEVEDV